MNKPAIPRHEVEKAQAIARHHAGVAARAQGAPPSAIMALATYGQKTIIGEGENALELLPQGLQVQLCLIELAKVFPHHANASLADGLEKLTHLALVYHDPTRAYQILTAPEPPDEVRRNFRTVAFELSAFFSNPEDIEKLSAHIAAQMGLNEEVTGETKKRSPSVVPGRGKIKQRR